MSDPRAQEPWVALLRQAVDQMGSQRAAEAIGYSRGLVSGVLNGNYAGNWDRVRERVETAFHTVACPYLERQITGHQCVEHQGRPADLPPADPDYWHARACAACRVGVGRTAVKAGAAKAGEP